LTLSLAARWSLLALTVAVTGCPTSSATPSPDAAAPPPARVAVAARGRLTPAGRIRSIAGLAGERVVRLEVAELDRVKAGQVLAVLESNDERRAARDLSRQNVASAERQLAAIERQGQAQIHLAELSLVQLEQVSGPHIQSMEDEVRRREAFLAQQKADLDRLGPLLERGAAREEEVVRQRHVVEQASSDLAGGRAQLEQLRRQTATDLELARATVDLRRAELERQREAIGLEGLRAQLALSEAQLARTEVRAPCDGQVLRVQTREGEVIGDRPILTMADTSHMIGLVEVYESDLRFLRLGLPARLTSPALPGELTGKVTKIGRVIARNQVYDLDPAADADVRVAEVEVTLDESEAASRFVSLQVDVVIDLQGGGAAGQGDVAPDTTASPSGS
jgi:HlyD family secretion protein